MKSAVDDHAVTAVRGFNRFYTGLIGVLREGLVNTPYSLTEARVIFELAQSEATEVADLRRALDLDAGYLSRMLARFEADRLITRERSSTDARRQVIRLTAQGGSVYEMLDERSGEDIRELLGGITVEQRRRLIAALGTVQEVLDEVPRPRAFVLRPLGPGDFGWVIHRNGLLYAEEYGWDHTYEALVARIVADYVDGHDPRRECGWIAEVDGSPVGCVFCVRKSDEVAQLRLLLVDPGVRGMGIGGRLVAECLRFAEAAGYAEIMLWTNDVLVDARRIYERAGFELEGEEPHHSFGHDLVGQFWRRSL
ncbi:helix-turn-helix domain-containing GNAT family N-acetyltransferase [Actinomadura sp. HBU206391]|uniref:bifunctional helix-turn-helix transcriptional regulator/GNAT family N-acetyltransferase n=1 Tax=Actinomadura sp. HBU206391 TaxID=2731692 RepID=UPI00164FE21D|nr:helix-turn-helix domain-containing GNAT family N-acetyltransferase [Actinomadura sp. HBU206391]MBC6462075.1 MarR family transcriptional regulator [Actinomadura sp. HBU206391]